MITAESLSSKTQKDLAQMAKRRGVPGWHAMRKDQLVKALIRLANSRSRLTRLTATSNASSGRVRNGLHEQPAKRYRTDGGRQSAGVTRRLAALKAKQERSKNLATRSSGENGHRKDRLVLMVRGPYWLHANWELTRQGVERAQAAMAQDWHLARPVLRLFEVASGPTTSTVETAIRDIEIHGGVSNWYIDVQDPPKSFRVDIGYAAPSGKFFALSRSNIVTTPRADAADYIDEHWVEVARDFEKIYAMSGGNNVDGTSGHLQELFEERLRRPMGSPVVARFVGGMDGVSKRSGFFEVDAELIVYGATEPDAHVTIHGDPVRLRPDGTFTVRYSLPNCRQVIPAVAMSADGMEQRTVVLAVERNTKTMEPLIREVGE